MIGPRLLLRHAESDRLRRWCLATYARAERAGDQVLAGYVINTVIAWDPAARLLTYFSRRPGWMKTVRVAYRATRPPRRRRRPSGARRRTRAIDIPGIYR